MHRVSSIISMYSRSHRQRKIRGKITINKKVYEYLHRVNRSGKKEKKKKKLISGVKIISLVGG